MANTATNVTVGKPAVGGAVFWAPLGTTLPTSASGTLDAAFKSLGYVSDDGTTNSNSVNTEDIKAWGGDTVATVQTETVDEWKFKLIESLNVDVLTAVYGDDNVEGTLTTGITVHANSDEVEAACWVIDQVMTGGVLQRTVIGNGKVSDRGDITYKDDEAVGFELTVKALPMSDGDTHKTYIIAP